MSASRVGALTGGFYLGFSFVALGIQRTPSGAQRLWVAGIAVIASLATTVIGLWLEKICQIPQPPQDSSQAGQRA
jgi:hypothetical protein